MKKLIKRIAQVATGAATAATLLAGRALASTYSVTDPADQVTTSSEPSATQELITGNPVQDGANAARAEGMPTEIQAVLSNITNIILFAVGIVSVVMLVWGGIRYITSGGDSKKVTDAKNTILYAVVGLIIALLSYSIVNFVISVLGGTSPLS